MGSWLTVMVGFSGQTQVTPCTRKGGLMAVAEAVSTGPTGTNGTTRTRKRASSLIALSLTMFQIKVPVWPSRLVVVIGLGEPAAAVAVSQWLPPSSEYSKLVLIIVSPEASRLLVRRDPSG